MSSIGASTFQATRTSLRGHALLSLNSLCLLEPLIGVVWQHALAKGAGVPLTWVDSLLLGGGLWLAYAADRFLDARRLAPHRIRTARHRFFHVHAEGLCRVWVCVLFASLLIAVWKLSAQAWAWSAGLIGIATAYLFWVQRHRPDAVRKRLSVAVVYALGVGAFVVPRADDPAPCVAMLACFGLLAFVNLSVIAAEEWRLDQQQGLEDNDGSGRDPTRDALWTAVALTVATLLLHGSLEGSWRPVSLTIAASALLLVWLLRAPGRGLPEASHALADILLLLPIVTWL